MLAIFIEQPVKRVEGNGAGRTIPSRAVGEQQNSVEKTGMVRDWENAYYTATCQFCVQRPGTTHQVLRSPQIPGEQEVGHQSHLADWLSVFWTRQYCRHHPELRMSHKTAWCLCKMLLEPCVFDHCHNFFN
jgi:hypothetical protein